MTEAKEQEILAELRSIIERERPERVRETDTQEICRGADEIRYWNRPDVQQVITKHDLHNEFPMSAKEASRIMKLAAEVLLVRMGKPTKRWGWC